MVTETRIKPRSASRAAPEEATSGALRWSVEQRLAFIEERLYWVGEAKRFDLVHRFGVSMSQASADIARYLALRPRVDYDRSAKRYVAGDDFRPVIAPPDAARLLGELPLVELGALAASDAMLGTVPPFSAAPLPARPVDASVLRAVLRAIRERRVLDVLYQSMSRPIPARRSIAPHALVYDGFRWHARAFDRETGSFRDFVFGRMTRPKVGDIAQTGGESDREWQSFVTLKIAPHPKLTPAQARAIAMDYGMRGGSAAIRVRRALLFYALRRLGLDIPENARPPQEQHIVLVNREEVAPASALSPDT